jgi:hypothetical protein
MLMPCTYVKSGSADMPRTVVQVVTGGIKTQVLIEEKMEYISAVIGCSVSKFLRRIAQKFSISNFKFTLLPANLNV